MRAHRSFIRLLKVCAIYYLSQESVMAQSTIVPIMVEAPTFSGSYSSSSTGFEVEDSHPDIERKTLSVEGRMPVQPGMVGTFMAGYIIDDEFSAARSADGSGVQAGAGLLANVHKAEALAINAFVGFEGVTENFRGNGTYKDLKINGTMFALRLGGVCAYELNQAVTPYAGLEIVPYNEGKYKFKLPSDSESFKVKREEMLNVIIGGQITAGQITFRPAVVAVGETSFVLSVGKTTN